MKQVSFIHMADLHLDAPFSSLVDPDKANIRRSELEGCLQKIIERVIAQNIDILIISGDFFEASSVRGTTILTVKNLFSELYRTEIIISPGNHDGLGNNSYYQAIEWGSNVHILEDAQQVLYLEKYNTCIYNLGTTGDVAKDYPLLLGKDIRSDKFNFLVFHGTVDMPFEEENYNSITSKELFSLGMDYVALGHMHCFSRFENGKTIIINPGSPEPMGFDEEGSHGFIQGKIILLEDGQKRVETDFIEAATRHYFNLEININDCKSDDEVIEKVDATGQLKFSPANLYSITLKGFIPKEYNLGIKNVLKAFERCCFFMKIKNQTSIQFEYHKYLEDPGIKGEFVRKLMDIIACETSELRRETLFMALQYGLQAIENGRVDQ